MAADFDLTNEQVAALAFFRCGMSLSLQAGAGVGKTSLLEVMGRSTKRFGTYTAFNRQAVLDAAARFPENVACSTTHSLAFRAVGRKYAHRLDAQRIRSGELARRLGLSHLTVRYGQQAKVLQPGYLASLVARTLGSFCFTADREPGPQHVPWLDGIDEPTATGARSTTNNQLVRAHITSALERGWADLMDPAGELMRYGHDHYMKAWQLSERPTISGDFILLDEAQDTAPVLLDVLARQTGQLVAVGDSQQQLYSWRGAVDALTSIPSESTAFLTKSWRFGPAIAEVANLVLAELPTDLRIEGCDTDSRVGAIDGTPDAVLCRSNAEAVKRVLQYQSAGTKVHLVGGGEDVARFAKAAQELAEKGWTSHPELACFESWKEVLAYVEQDPSGSELKLLTGLVEEFTTEVILEALERMPAEDVAEVVVSTAHKSKGREWDRVQLAADFQMPTGLDAAGEWRLLYVAATRARRVLDPRMCEPLQELLDPEVRAARQREQRERELLFADPEPGRA